MHRDGQHTLAPPAGGESSGRTAKAVAAQLAAMDCEHYELGVYDSAMRQMTLRICATDSVMTSLGWLKHKNANGADIYMRPHGSVGLLLVDDVTPTALKKLYADGLDPATVVLTSTDNDQAWVRVSASPITEDLGTAAARELV